MPALPFTLWLSPDVWPKSALRLLGKAHTLWLDPESWPRPPLRLPSDGFTLWLDDKTWAGAVPAPALEEPEISFPEPPAEPVRAPVTNLLWLDTESWPVPLALEPPVRTEPAAAAPAEGPPVPFPSIESPPPVATPDIPAMTSRLTLPANHSFTLWTTPAALAGAVKTAAPSVPLLKTTAPKLRLPAQPFTLWAQPGRVEPILMRNVTKPASAGITASTTAPVAGANRWLPLAAGIAIAALFGMSYSSQKAQREKAESDLAALQTKTSAEVEAAKSVSQKAQATATAASTKLAAREAEMKGQMAELKTAVTKAEQSAKEKAGLADAKTAELNAAQKALGEAKKEYAAKETALQASATALTEEMSKVKKAAGEEASKALEAIARLEEEKAAAVKEATNAMADRDVLKVEVEKLRKQLEQKAKPPGGPEA